MVFVLNTIETDYAYYTTFHKRGSTEGPSRGLNTEQPLTSPFLCIWCFFAFQAFPAGSTYFIYCVAKIKQA